MFGNKDDSNNGGRNFERAVGFINISILNADGSEIKMPKGIPLRMSNKVERGLFEYLEANSDAVIQFSGKYQVADDTTTEFALPSAPAETVDAEASDDVAPSV